MHTNPTPIRFSGKAEAPASFTQLCKEWVQTMQIIQNVTKETLFLEQNPDICLTGIREVINV